MNVTRCLYGLLFVALLSSCSQFKSLTSRDTSNKSSSAKSTAAKKTATKKVRFLDNISVAPGQVVTSKHVTEGPSMAPLSKRIQERESYNRYVRPLANAGDIEKVDWLQLKYAIVLDATVETLKNLNLLTLIDEWWGTDYCMGGSTKNCVDCSAFTNIIMRSVYNVNLPRTAQEQFNLSRQIGMEDLNEGDLVFFHTGGREISHVGVYLQNNKFVHAATSEGVMVSDLNDSYWKGRYKGAGRYINSTASAGN